MRKTSISQVFRWYLPDDRVFFKFNIGFFQEVFISVVMVVLVAVITSLWLYNILELKKEVQGEIVNVITTLGPVRCKNCVEFLPDYSALFASVVSSFPMTMIVNI